MSYYRTCPHCGANLDPGEMCDCQIGAALLLTVGAAERWGDEKTAVSSVKADSGKAEQTLTGPVSASYDTRETEGFQV